MLKEKQNLLHIDKASWNTFSPLAKLSPIFHCSKEDEEFYLEIEGNGDERVLGCWETFFDLEGHHWYEVSVKATISRIENPDSSLLAVAAGHFLELKKLDEEDYELSLVFWYEGDEEYKDRFSLFLRGTKMGKVRWQDPKLKEVCAPPKRIARIATIHFEQIKDKKNQTFDSLRERIRYYLEEVGKVQPDLVLLTENAPVSGIDTHELEKYEKIVELLKKEGNSYNYQVAESVPDGPTCLILSEEAKKYGMYVVAGLPERRGDYIYNTSVIFGRNGEFIGQYDKTHLTFGELMNGISCGDAYPVFELDFGKVAIHICYDEWFPEVARYYAHQGAEILLLPVAGGKPITWRTRALDNDIYFVSASDNPPSMIIDSSGEILAETHRGGFVYADLDMNDRRVNWYGDKTLIYGMPGVTSQMKNTLNRSLLKSLAQIYEGGTAE